MKTRSFPFLVILFTSAFFGAVAFICVAILISLLFLYTERDTKKSLIVMTSAFLPLVWYPLIIVPLGLAVVVMNDDNFSRVFSFAAAIFVVFILFPVLNLLLYTSPSEIYDVGLINAITVSFVSATISTLIALFLALPLGYVLARWNFEGKRFIESIIDIPIVIPHTVAGIVLLLVFGTSGIIGAPLSQIGIKFYYALPGIVIAMLFVSSPFLINQIREGIEKIDPRYEYTAMNLGASRFRAFWDVVLPLIKRNILAGSVNAWARAVSEFGAVMMIAFYPMIAPTYIYFLYTNYGLKEALPATAFLLLLTLGIFGILRYMAGRDKND